VTARRHPPLDAPGPAPRRPRLLLVDDDPQVARAVGRMLEHSGFEVTTCGDAEGALERFRGDPAAFDAVVTDQSLPRMSGDALTSALLAIRPGLPVVICTGYSEGVDDERARALGARAFFPKPLDLRELVAVLRAAVGA
jgi:CheY-like chemotaxis protein